MSDWFEHFDEDLRNMEESLRERRCTEQLIYIGERRATLDVVYAESMNDEYYRTSGEETMEDEMIVIGPDDEPRMISLRNEKERVCQKCKRTIYYSEYIKANIIQHWKTNIEMDGVCQRDPKLDLKQIWESKYVQLLCCACVQAKEQIENDKKMKNWF